MAMIVTEDGKAVIATSLQIPRHLVEEARRLEINRSKLFRDALAAEIDRRKRKAEAQEFADTEASATPLEAKDGRITSR